MEDLEIDLAISEEYSINESVITQEYININSCASTKYRNYNIRKDELYEDYFCKQDSVFKLNVIRYINRIFILNKIPIPVELQNIIKCNIDVIELSDEVQKEMLKNWIEILVTNDVHCSDIVIADIILEEETLRKELHFILNKIVRDFTYIIPTKVEEIQGCISTIFADITPNIENMNNFCYIHSFYQFIYNIQECNIEYIEYILHQNPNSNLINEYLNYLNFLYGIRNRLGKKNTNSLKNVVRGNCFLNKNNGFEFRDSNDLFHEVFKNILDVFTITLVENSKKELEETSVFIDTTLKHVIISEEVEMEICPLINCENSSDGKMAEFIIKNRDLITSMIHRSKKNKDILFSDIEKSLNEMKDIYLNKYLIISIPVNISEYKLIIADTNENIKYENSLFKYELKLVSVNCISRIHWINYSYRDCEGENRWIKYDDKNVAHGDDDQKVEHVDDDHSDIKIFEKDENIIDILNQDRCYNPNMFLYKVILAKSSIYINID